MNFDGRVHIVVPCNGIVAEFQPNENLLALMGTSTKDVIELYLTKWLDHQKFGYTPGYYDGYMPVAASASMSVRYMAMDLLFEMLERRLENRGKENPDPAPDIDRKDFEKILLNIWAWLSEELFPLFQTLGFKDQQIERMVFEQWLGDDVIVSIPTEEWLREEARVKRDEEIHARLEAQRRAEFEGVEAIRAASPFCGHHRSLGDHGTVVAYSTDEGHPTQPQQPVAADDGVDAV